MLPSNTQTRRRLVTAFSQLVISVLVASMASLPGHAAPITWDGGFGGSDGWSKKKNWNNQNLAGGDDLFFGGTTRLTNTNDTAATTNYVGITFNSGAGAFTLGGNSITLGGNVTNNSANLQTIDLAMILSATRTFNTASGNLAIGGVISGATFGITKTGSGNTLTLTGASTYSGTTTITAGTLQLGNGTTGNDGTITNSLSIVNSGSLGADSRFVGVIVRG
jgi:autotransporter-associated beta strand protein